MDKIELPGGFYASIEIDYEQGAYTPWNWCDGRGEVSEWTRRDKAPGERVLCEDRGLKRYYDYAGAIAKAKAEGWDAEPYGGTKGEKAARAVDADFEFLRAWCNNQWHYAAVTVTLHDADGNECRSDSCGMIETWKDYHETHAREVADYLHYTETLNRSHAWRMALKEARERRYWINRGVMTKAA